MERDTAAVDVRWLPITAKPSAGSTDSQGPGDRWRGRRLDPPSSNRRVVNANGSLVFFFLLFGRFCPSHLRAVIAVRNNTPVYAGAEAEAK